jgi:hypothetical protein
MESNCAGFSCFFWSVSMDHRNKDFFEEFGLTVETGEIEIGRTYPIFGAITKLVNDEPGHVLAEINYSILARMNIPDRPRVEILKKRAFESGIFVCTITSKDPGVEADCRTVIFGKEQAGHA